MNSNAPVVVLGDGTSAVFVVDQLVQRGERVVWVEGSGSPLLPALPELKSDRALGVLSAAAQRAGVSHSAQLERGLCHRVFRSKAFKVPTWKKTAEQTWAPELLHLGEQELRVEGLDPARIEESLRASLEGHELVTRVRQAPVIEFEVQESGGQLQFANGFTTAFQRFYFCDSLSMLKGFPKLQTVFRNQMQRIHPGSRYGALQVVFRHSAPVQQFLGRGMLIPMNRDAGENFDRNVLGYFSEATRSIWTVYLQPRECEENHEIMKKLRKLKQSLQRAFEGTTDFLSTIEREQVRFEEHAVYTGGAIEASPSNPDFVLFSDAFGLTSALERIALHFGINPPNFELGGMAEGLELDSLEIPAHVAAPADIPEPHPSI